MIHDYIKFGIKSLKDGLTMEIIKEKFPWILRANIERAVLGIDNEGKIIWYGGTWYNGIWENGTWMHGTWYKGFWIRGEWVDGVWHDGTINGKKTMYNPKFYKND